MQNIQTADFCDANPDCIQVVWPGFRRLGGLYGCGGSIVTVKVFEDNSLLQAVLEAPGNGQMLVVDGGGSMRCALLNEDLALLAVGRGWAGVIVNGCIRNSVAIGNIALGVFALGVHPLGCGQRGIGESNVPVTFGGATFYPGDYVYADNDGIIVSKTALR